MVRVNGEEKNAAGMTIEAFLLQEGYRLDRIVVERNLEIVPKEQYAMMILEDNDSVEVLRFVGGG